MDFDRDISSVLVGRCPVVWAVTIMQFIRGAVESEVKRYGK
jgi:hypothetical protein